MITISDSPDAGVEARDPWARAARFHTRYATKPDGALCCLSESNARTLLEHWHTVGPGHLAKACLEGSEEIDRQKEPRP